MEWRIYIWWNKRCYLIFFVVCFTSAELDLLNLLNPQLLRVKFLASKSFRWWARHCVQLIFLMEQPKNPIVSLQSYSFIDVDFIHCVEKQNSSLKQIWQSHALPYLYTNITYTPHKAFSSFSVSIKLRRALKLQAWKYNLRNSVADMFFDCHSEKAEDDLFWRLLIAARGGKEGGSGAVFLSTCRENVRPLSNKGCKVNYSGLMNGLGGVGAAFHCGRRNFRRLISLRVTRRNADLQDDLSEFSD